MLHMQSQAEIKNIRDLVAFCFDFFRVILETIDKDKRFSIIHIRLSESSLVIRVQETFPATYRYHDLRFSVTGKRWEFVIMESEGNFVSASAMKVLGSFAMQVERVMNNENQAEC